MIYQFDNITVTDHSKSIQDADYFLITQQNRQYAADIPNAKIIIPRDLINQYELNTIKTVGVTGTNGKTTTAAAIYSYLNDLGFTAALQGTRGFFIGDEQIEKKSLTTPPILQTLYHMYTAKQQGATHFVMEVSSHAIAQKRIEDLQFALKVFTNISQDHLDYHKTMQNYIATKSSFFMDEGSKLINKDDKHIQYNPKGARTYSVEELATYQILAYSMQNGISAVLRFGNEMIDFHAPMIGLFNLYNITAAISAVHMLTNLPLQQICEVTEHFAGVRGRMQILSEEPLIIVDFAHTPDGMQKVFESFPGRKIVALFGAGGDRDRSKRALMGNIASRFCTKIYLTSDNPRSEHPKEIIEDIAKGIETDVHVEKIVDRKEAIEQAIRALQTDEILLILGKGDEEYIEYNGKKIPYSDVDTVQSLLKS
ncbi:MULTISPECIES: UDP-N-acetylmuramoyl-L-alanyl-D-glutamate--2,6-diaminopimelate ligase [unclassified Nitratiruptor]|uniref:UDP-N-acetylmuramoyl-L-alanyl-D-glutamate--2, 6-diaminopimelate ligase n=1 Tax=unclassified Nitratiruptor TaxID=2624044 RepID=UPI001915412E|nr:MULTISPECIES: UDP-N-acetylmuramoyl-L-alanyl-D-glutamate--2,6-diaminopimelate ligase [unclassified Nitratiruptor]BCD59522.1 UDP-N-acetylmuramoyl-L-alanyl-D-glutamate--2,6-diaminopimelate ligase [Nitratiruptor sp. YY08-10]BCD63446.1 UDP-N-acetylmuramoyl-L-alanyl-D-glutamate--2,6-diaminopimelate ligase [Nitratiruptor sp. YY08-14]